MEILNYALSLSGIDEDTRAKILNSEGLKGIEVSDEVTSKVKQSLTTLENAKNHPDITSHFKGTLFGIVDNTVKESLIEAGYSEDDVKSLFNGKQSAERVKAAIAKAMEKGKLSASKSGNEQIEELRGLLAQKETSFHEEINKYKSVAQQRQEQIEAIEYKIALKEAVSGTGLKLIDLDSRLVDISLNTLVSDKLNELKAVPKVVNGKIKLFRADDLESEHFIGTEKTDFYKLLPSAIDSIVEKKQAPERKTVHIDGSTIAKNGVDAARNRAFSQISKR